jgi:hypothetical protein
MVVESTEEQERKKERKKKKLPLEQWPTLKNKWSVLLT